jgi:hypothetical protein
MDSAREKWRVQEFLVPSMVAMIEAQILHGVT